MPDTPKYELLDIEERQELWPWSVSIPPLTSRMNVLPGDKVKLIFMREHIGSGTSAWVNVTTSPHPDPRSFHRQLAESVPNLLTLGDHVDFEPRHVSDIILKARPHSWSKNDRPK